MKRKLGPWALPLPPLPSRPKWMRGFAHTGQGGYETPAWASDFYEAVQRGRVGLGKSKPVPMPETEIDRWGQDFPTRWVWSHGDFVEVPVRNRQVCQGWDPRRGVWVTLKNTEAIRKFARVANL